MSLFLLRASLLLPNILNPKKSKTIHMKSAYGTKGDLNNMKDFRHSSLDDPQGRLSRPLEASLAPSLD